MRNRGSLGGVVGAMVAVQLAAIGGPQPLAAARAAEPVDLRPRFAVEQPIYVETRAVSKQTVNMTGLPQPMESDFHVISGFHEKGMSSGDAVRVHCRIARRAMGMKSAMLGAKDYDSDSGAKPADDDSMGLMGAPWVGAELEIALEADGRTGAIAGFDKLKTAVDESAMGDQLYEMMKEGLLGEVEVGHQLIGRRIAMLADKKVAVGDTWTRSLRLDTASLGSTLTAYACKLDKTEKRDGRDVAVVSYTLETSIPADAKPLARFGAVPKIKSSKGSGVVVFDLATGQPIDLREQAVMDMSIERPAPSGEGTMSIDVHIEEEYTAKAMTDAEREKQKAENRKAVQEAAKSASQPGDDD